MSVNIHVAVNSYSTFVIIIVIVIIFIFILDDVFVALVVLTLCSLPH